MPIGSLTNDQIRAMMPNAGHRLDQHLPFIWPAMQAAAIDEPLWIAAFMAQLAHESGEYRYMEEIADGSAYEGAARLGNTQPGDGVRFKGHGPIQITGRANHKACGEALGIDLIAQPELLCTPKYGTRAACWFWNSHRLSPLAELGWFTTITHVINGGENGLSDRWQYYDRNLQLLGLAPLNRYTEIDRIRDFQEAHGLMADGVVGPITHVAVARGK